MGVFGVGTANGLIITKTASLSAVFPCDTPVVDALSGNQPDQFAEYSSKPEFQQCTVFFGGRGTGGWVIMGAFIKM